MLFSEDELTSLDTLNKIEEKPKKKRILVADQPHYIHLTNTGVLELNRNEKMVGKVKLFEVPNLKAGMEVLNSVPDMKRRGLYMIPKWGNNSTNSGWSVSNLRACNSWFLKMRETLGYENRNKYKIINDPSDMVDRAFKKRNNRDQAEIEETKKLLESVDEIFKAKQLEKIAIEEDMLNASISNRKFL